jgi:hypothetical protein
LKLGVGDSSEIPALRRLRQQDQEFEASLGCLCKKIRKKKRKKGKSF